MGYFGVVLSMAAYWYAGQAVGSRAWCICSAASKAGAKKFSCCLTFFKFLSFCDGLGRFLGHLLILCCVFSFCLEMSEFLILFIMFQLLIHLWYVAWARARIKKPVKTHKM